MLEEDDVIYSVETTNEEMEVLAGGEIKLPQAAADVTEKKPEDPLPEPDPLPVQLDRMSSREKKAHLKAQKEKRLLTEIELERRLATLCDQRLIEANLDLQNIQERIDLQRAEATRLATLKNRSVSPQRRSRRKRRSYSSSSSSSFSSSSASSSRSPSPRRSRSRSRSVSKPASPDRKKSRSRSSSPKKESHSRSCSPKISKSRSPPPAPQKQRPSAPQHSDERKEAASSTGEDKECRRVEYSKAGYTRHPPPKRNDANDERRGTSNKRCRTPSPKRRGRTPPRREREDFYSAPQSHSYNRGSSRANSDYYGPPQRPPFQHPPPPLSRSGDVYYGRYNTPYSSYERYDEPPYSPYTRNNNNGTNGARKESRIDRTRFETKPKSDSKQARPPQRNDREVKRSPQRIVRKEKSPPTVVEKQEADQSLEEGEQPRIAFNTKSIFYDDDDI